MAMIKCPMCEEEVSDKAKKCPHCGSGFKRNKVKAIIIAVVSVILMLSLIYGAVTGIKNYQKQKTIQEYNESVYETVVDFHDAFKLADEKVKTGNYTSLESVVNTLRTPIKNFDKLSVNADSEVGQYIDSIKHNSMYTTFKAQYIDSDYYDLDYGLTSGGYARIISVYTEKILEVEFPKFDK